MNASDIGEDAENQITPQPADQTPQDHQPQDQPPHDQPPQDQQAQQDQPPHYDDRPGYQSIFDNIGSGSNGPLYRPLHGRMIAGVAAGIADYLGIDVNVVRIVLAVLTFVGGLGLPIYVAGWLLIPDEGAGQSVASELIGSLQGHWN
jgi:phage shock protein C